MKIDFWLVISESGKIYCRKTKPTLYAEEIAVKMNLKLPDELFSRPVLKADIAIDSDMVASYPMDTKVVSDIQNAVKQATGMDLSITVMDPKEEEEQLNDGQ